MTKSVITAVLLAGAAFAQTYTPITPPGSLTPGMNIQVVRTDNGATSHLSVAMTLPPPPPNNKSFALYTRAFFYGWITMGKERLIVGVSDCFLKKTVTGESGFPTTAGQWKAGDRVTLEIDVPKSFANADGAHLHFGIGDASYFPSPNLLPIPATK
jgi:hypothetical protein